MDTILNGLRKTINHIDVLHSTFTNRDNFADENVIDFNIYNDNLIIMQDSLEGFQYSRLLYSENQRQMILSDFLEYIFFGRFCYALENDSDRGNFIKAIISLVNMLMCFETVTVTQEIRRNFLKLLGRTIAEIRDESEFNNLLNHVGDVGLAENVNEAPHALKEYFDTLLPKTAGGLWHELLTYIFLLRSDVGYIIPLLLTQKIIGLRNHIIPPDFLILAHDKRIYGIEVGGFKERQSSNFVLRTAIPTVSVDTRNSRTDRCPICKKWINFCPYIIDNYSNLRFQIERSEVKCLNECDRFLREDIANGNCIYSKYSRRRINAEHTHHEYANGFHYHYKCVLENVEESIKNQICNANDVTAIKCHYPNYSGLEGLFIK